MLQFDFGELAEWSTIFPGAKLDSKAGPKGEGQDARSKAAGTAA